jgi:hypothetical protein
VYQKIRSCANIKTSEDFFYNLTQKVNFFFLQAPQLIDFGTLFFVTENPAKIAKCTYRVVGKDTLPSKNRLIDCQTFVS